MELLFPIVMKSRLLMYDNIQLVKVNYLFQEGLGVHSMVIHRIEMADSGQFTCLAENSAGEARSTADLVYHLSLYLSI